MKDCASYRKRLASSATDDSSEDMDPDLSRHLRGCPNCRRYFTDLSRVHVVLTETSLPETCVDTDAFHRTLTGAIQSRRPIRRILELLSHGWPRILVPVSLCAMVAFLAISIMSRDHARPDAVRPAEISESTEHVVADVKNETHAARASLGYYRSLAGNSLAALDEALLRPDSVSDPSLAPTIVTAGLNRDVIVP